MPEHQERFVEAASKQLRRTTTAFGLRPTEEQLETMARALFVRLEGDGWKLMPP